MNDDFWRPQDTRSKAEIVADGLSRLTFTPATEAPPKPTPVLSLYRTDEQRLADLDREDRLDMPLAESEERQKRIGVWRGTRYTAGDPEGRAD